MERAVAFYRDTLGLELISESPWWSELSLGGTKLGLHPPFQADRRRGGGWVIGVEVSDLRALRAKLAEAGYPTTNGYHDVPGGVVLDFADPDGNPLQAMQTGAKASELA